MNRPEIVAGYLKIRREEENTGAEIMGKRLRGEITDLECDKAIAALKSKTLLTLYALLDKIVAG